MFSDASPFNVAVPPAILGFNLEAHDVSAHQFQRNRARHGALMIQHISTTFLSGAPNEPHAVSQRGVDQTVPDLVRT